jgi:ankyrin repeat protein
MFQDRSNHIAAPGQEGWLRDQENAASATESAQTGWWIRGFSGSNTPPFGHPSWPGGAIILAMLILLAATPLLSQTTTPSLANLIEAGNRKAALERIRAGADVNAAQPDGTRPIHWAIYHLDYELLSALIARKANVNVRNEFGVTPIAEAARLGDARLVKMLLDAGAEPEGVNADGQTALMLAIKTGDVPVVDMLIKAGANVNRIEEFHNQTPLMWAASAPRNAGALVKLLLSKGADFKPRALYTDWPSQITSEPRAQYRPVGGLTALLYAARDGCYECVDALVTAGADVNRPTPEGVTPLMIALDNGHNDVAKLLLDRGANPGLWDWWGRTALYIAVDRKNPVAQTGAGAASIPAGPRNSVSSMDIINVLLAADIDINARLNFHRPSRSGNSGRFIEPLQGTGGTALMRATVGMWSPDNKDKGGDLEVVRALLVKGANPHINDMGVTPFLIAAGVNAGTTGGTGLAAQWSAAPPANMELMELLLQHGANVNDQVTGTLTYSLRVTRAPSANEGRTALHIAAQEGKADLVRYLLGKGANPEIVDAGGMKAIDLATVDEIRSLLQNAAAERK